MKNPVTNPAIYHLENKKQNVVETFYLLLDQSCDFLKNLFTVIWNSSLVQKAIQVVQIASVLVSSLYVLNLIALTANCFSAILGGNPGLSMNVQYQLFIGGLWFIPFTICISVSFLKRVF